MLKEYPLNGRGEAAGQGPALLGFGNYQNRLFGKFHELIRGPYRKVGVGRLGPGIRHRGLFNADLCLVVCWSCCSAADDLLKHLRRREGQFGSE